MLEGFELCIPAKGEGQQSQRIHVAICLRLQEASRQTCHRGQHHTTADNILQLLSSIQVLCAILQHTMGSPISEA